MSLELILLLVFVAGLSLQVLFGERVFAIIGAVAGLLYVVIEIVKSVR